MLEVTDGIGYWNKQAMLVGEKIAATKGNVSYNLSGMLYIKDGSHGTWGMLSVPNALVHGVFSAMDETGIELPPSGSDEKLNAHITVFRPDEIKMLGGADKMKNDRGKRFVYTVGRLVSFDPRGWPEMAKAWVLRVHSPELQSLRRSYGLSSLPNDGKFDFHITVAVRRKKVLGRNETSKATAA